MVFVVGFRCVADTRGGVGAVGWFRRQVETRLVQTVGMAGDIDYRRVEVPAETPPEEFSYTERRAALLARIEEEGQPWTLNKSALGRKYGVSHTTIANDFEALGAHIAQTLGDDHALATNAVLRRCIRGLLAEERWAEAARITLRHEEWLMDIGAVERAPEKQELDATINPRDYSTESYTIMTKDENGEFVDAPSRLERADDS